MRRGGKGRKLRAEDGRVGEGREGKGGEGRGGEGRGEEWLTDGPQYKFLDPPMLPMYVLSLITY
jgi:hypothetical protein